MSPHARHPATLTDEQVLARARGFDRAHARHKARRKREAKATEPERFAPWELDPTLLPKRPPGAR